MLGWSALRRFAGGFRRRRLSEEAVGILLETARSGERDFPETVEGAEAVDELLEAGYVEVYQPTQGDTVFTRQGSIQEAIEAQTYASRPRLAITSDGATLARRLAPRMDA
jgi:hypothetical protein